MFQPRKGVWEALRRAVGSGWEPQPRHRGQGETWGLRGKGAARPGVLVGPSSSRLLPEAAGPWMGSIRERQTWPSFPDTTWEELEKVTGVFWKKICDSPNCSAGLQLPPPNR